MAIILIKKYGFLLFQKRNTEMAPIDIPPIEKKTPTSKNFQISEKSILIKLATIRYIKFEVKVIIKTQNIFDDQ